VRAKLVPVAARDAILAPARPSRAARRVRINVDRHGRSLGNRLAARRRLLGLLQAELASRAGCDVRSVSRIESEQHGPSCELLAALARALETTMDALWCGEGEG
jgi:DNA-binding XRE family transcriptional regulator